MKAPIVIFVSVFQLATTNALLNPSLATRLSSSSWYQRELTRRTGTSSQIQSTRQRRSWNDDWEKQSSRPEFIIEDDDDFSQRSSRRSAPPDFTIDNDDADDDDPYNNNEESSLSTKNLRPKVSPSTKKRSVTKMVGTSWMEKNSKFTDEEDDNGTSSRNEGTWNTRQRSSSNNNNNNKQRVYGMKEARPSMDDQNFRQNFRGTRVFVQGIPPGASWQDLKDHFKVAGSVVFSSVSVDPRTGESKGHGIVQFETTAMAQNAINIMRDYPLQGSTLFVREDVQESTNPEARLSSSLPTKRGPTPPTKWKCANEDNAEYMSPNNIAAIRSLLKARDDARRRRKFEVSDRIRDELKYTHGVFIDDRLSMWWTAIDGNKVPQTIQDINGDGRWKLQSWRHIPTTPENDACVNPDLVEGLLKQRDIARREKDFKTADALLEEARISPDGDLTLRIHDETRTWRVWTEAPPPRPKDQESWRPVEEDSVSSEDPRERVIRECLAIVQEFAPHKVDEIKAVLEKFEGREYQILKRLKNQYL